MTAARTMCAWIDPKDARGGWGRSSDGETEPDPIEPTEERAHAASLPFQYKERRAYEGTLGGVSIDGVEYTSGDVTVNGGVAADKTLKLHARGLLWPDDSGGDRARRFKLQVVREPPVTDSVPYGEYEVWQRYQQGSVNVDDVTGPSFDPAADTIETTRTVASFGDLLEPTRLRVSELELVRNAPFAAYRLRERGDWEAYGAVFRWEARAFQQRV